MSVGSADMSVMSNFVYAGLPSGPSAAFCIGSFTSKSESFERVVSPPKSGWRRGAAGAASSSIEPSCSRVPLRRRPLSKHLQISVAAQSVHRGWRPPKGRRGAVELLKVPVEEGDEVLGGGVPEEGEEELRPHFS